MGAEAGDASTVHLEGVPVRTFLESQDHQHDLVRELQLIQMGDRFDTGTADVSHRLAQLISDILSRYNGVRSATRDQMMAALERGEESAPLDVPVYPGIVEALRSWLALLDEADHLCHHGELLLLATPPEIKSLREWYVSEITGRLSDP